MKCGSTLLRFVLCASLLAAACSDSPAAPDARPAPPARVAASLAVSAGTEQNGVERSRLPVAPAVVVRDQSGRALAGQLVSFVVVQGGGTVDSATATTRADGVAKAGSWTLGTAGPNEVEARLGSLAPVRFRATATPAPPPLAGNGAYTIAVRYLVSATPRQQQAVTAAVQRWQDVITRDLQDIPAQASAGACFPTQPALNETIDDVLILIEFAAIDGPGRTLAEAGPCFVRNSDELPVIGHLKIDTADLERLETTGTLDDVVLHEIGHVLGVGTLWPARNLLTGAGTTDPGFTGANALAAYLTMGGFGAWVPVENTGAVGTREGHWRESVFGNELMTGWIGGPPNPLSSLTIASLLDLGYGADPGQANSFELNGVTLRSAALLHDLRNNERIVRPKWKIDRTGRKLPH